MHGRDRMREALEELRRLQAPYLNWTGKAERARFEVEMAAPRTQVIDPPETVPAPQPDEEQSQ